jgi:hypothetical protein
VCGCAFVIIYLFLKLFENYYHYHHYKFIKMIKKGSDQNGVSEKGKGRTVKYILCLDLVALFEP